MMHLIDLPTELLEQVAQHCLQTGFDGNFVNWVLSCRSIFDAASNCISTYNELKKWRNVVMSDGNSPARTSLDILAAITEQPLVAYYIEVLDLRHGLSGEDEWDGWNEWMEEQDEGSTARKLFTNEKFAALVRQSHYLRKADQDPEQWLSRMRKVEIPANPYHDEGFPFRFVYRAIFLLSLLPSLKTLSPPEEWTLLRENRYDPPTELQPVLNEIVEQATAKRSFAALSRLERLLPFNEQVEYDTRDCLELITPFMALPALNEVHIINIVAADEDGNRGLVDWPHSAKISNVRKLWLEGCCFDARGMQDLLSRTPKLSSLAYAHDVKRDAYGDLWDVGALITTIAENNAATFTDLSITSITSPNELETGMESLKTLHKLENLKLDCSPFRDPDETTPSLSDILPGSICDVELWINGSIDREIRLHLALFREPEVLARPEEFPHLRRLVVYYGAQIQYEGAEIGPDTRAFTNKDHVRDVNELRRRIEIAQGRMLPDPDLTDAEVTQPVHHAIPWLTDPNYNGLFGGPRQV